MVRFWASTTGFLCAFLAFTAFTELSFGESGQAGGVLKMGRWVGDVQLEGRPEAFAATIDILTVQPDDATEFPHLEAILRLSLGGYSGGEYESESFQNIHYDFNSGLLTFDEPGTDLTVSGYVYQAPLRIEGQVFSRSTAQAGTIRLEYADDDEPGDGEPDGSDNGGGDDGEPGGADGGSFAVTNGRNSAAPTFYPSLAGQYEGECAGKRAILQIETGRGFESVERGSGLKHYSIRGALGFEDNVLCPGTGSIGRPNWCVDRSYTDGTFDFLLGRLSLSARLGADTCKLGAQGTLSCLVRISDTNQTCRLQKTDVSTKPFSASKQRYFIRTTSEQRLPLPEPSAPLHTDLLAALGGTFSGYLFHEGKNRYQPLKINIVSSRSTPNPHNENGIFVSPTAYLYFGDGISQDFWPHPLDRRPFYIRPGFTLQAAGTDAQLQVTSWRMGVISGVWYSKAFGKVGSFELVKSPTLPLLDAQAKFIPSVVGEFRGPRDRPAGPFNQWWMQTVVPIQPLGQALNVLTFHGVYQMNSGTTAWPRREIKRGTYDVYAGDVSFLAYHDPEDPTFVLGRYEDSDKMQLFWPSAQKWGVGFFDFSWNSYARMP